MKEGTFQGVTINGKEMLSLKGVKGTNKTTQQNQSKQKTKRKEQSKKRENGENEKTSKKQTKNFATAPYNFVPINKEICILSDKDSLKSLEKYNGNTGYIDLEIENLTPIYIRDTYNNEELAERRADKTYINPDFFSPTGPPSIPGSSLRGMTRSLVEIVSYGKMEYVDDKKLFYRKIAERGTYQNLMLAGSRKTGFYPNTKPGWLKKEGSRYKIYPLKKEKAYRFNATSIGGNRWKIEFENGNTKKLNPFSFHPVSFISATVKSYRHGGKKNILLRYAKVERIQEGHSKAEEDANYQKGYLILTGSLGNKKHMHPIIHEPDFKTPLFEIPNEIIENYIIDSQRAEAANLIEKAKKASGGIPCFYLEEVNREDKGKLLFFGHTPFFRLPYDKNIIDHLPKKHVDSTKSKKRDFAQSIFGDTEKSAGKVFFESAKLVNEMEPSAVLTPKILSGPKPTSFQLYLEQGNRNKRNYAHWGDSPNEKTDEGLIRGHKIYWHRIMGKDDDLGWCETVVDKHSTQHTQIRPINAGGIFKGRVRFENLSDEELGALLFVLDLPEKHRHKIGMGKPLGLGSIKITSKLVLTNRKGKTEKLGRYNQLFSNQSWYLAEEEKEENSIDKYKDDFAKYVLAAIEKNKTTSIAGYNDLWQTERLKELKTMLHYDEVLMQEADWLKTTQYMELEESGKRAVLNKPHKIKNK